MRYITILGEADRAEAVREAAEVVGGGGIAACPTETYYALCARWDNEETLRYMLEIKGRSASKPFPLIIGSPQLLGLITDEVNSLARKLTERFWPGPLTILFRARSDLPITRFLAKDGKVAVRMPGESFALSLARAMGVPITATSANVSGMPPGRTAADVMGYFDARIELLIDEGKPTPGGEPSTIVDTDGGKINIVREGAIASHILEEI